MPIPSPAQSLRTATTKVHRELESLDLFNRLMQNSVDIAHYRLLLQVQYCFHAQIEPALQQAFPAKHAEFAYQPRLPLLAEDLAALHGDLPQINNVEPAFASPAAAWGSRYVIEGSALGGRLIVKHLQQHLPAVIPQACNFYQFSHIIAADWIRFQACLDQHLQDPEQLAIAIEQARQTFTLLADLAA